MVGVICSFLHPATLSLSRLSLPPRSLPVAMNTEKPKPDQEERLIQYRLSPDELRDRSKLKFKLMSMEAVFAYAQLAAAASGVPGLGAAVAALEGVRVPGVLLDVKVVMTDLWWVVLQVVNSVDRVKSHR